MDELHSTFNFSVCWREFVMFTEECVCRVCLVLTPFLPRVMIEGGALRGGFALLSTPEGTLLRVGSLYHSWHSAICVWWEGGDCISSKWPWVTPGTPPGILCNCWGTIINHISTYAWKHIRSMHRCRARLFPARSARAFQSCRRPPCTIRERMIRVYDPRHRAASGHSARITSHFSAFPFAGGKKRVEWSWPRFSFFHDLD